MGSIRQIFPKNHERWLDNDATLWRYVPLRTLFHYLTGRIFIPSIEKLRQGDPFEGEFFFDTAWFHKALQARYGKNHKIVVGWLHKQLSSEELKYIESKENEDLLQRFYENHYFEFLRNTRFAWCWFASNIESAAMWNIYGSEGVAIKTTVKRLIDVVSKTTNDFAFGQMRYVSVTDGQTPDLVSENPEDAQLVLEPHFLKRNEFESENEVRFVTSSMGNQYNPGIVLRGIKPDEWIQEIRFWPKLDYSEAWSLREVVQKFAPNLSCDKSRLMNKPSKRKDFTPEKLLTAAMIRDFAWKDMTDDIPQILKYP